MVKGYEEMVQRSNSNINKHVKRCLISLIVRQIQMKVIMRYNFCYKTSKNLKERTLTTGRNVGGRTLICG